MKQRLSGKAIPTVHNGYFLTHCRYSAWNTAAEGALVPEYLEQVVNQGDEIPLTAHIGKVSQGEGSKTARRFALAECRFR